MTAERGDPLPPGAAIGITGANGFVGSALAERFARDGFAVVPFVRRPAEHGPAARAYALGAVPDLAGLGALVHCAFAPAVRGGDAVARNVEGTIALWEAAMRLNVPFAFLSSVNAVPSVESAYSRQKRAIEERIAASALVLRPGLVAGEGGVFASLAASAAMRAVPLVDGGRQRVQLTAPDDLYRALLAGLRAGLRGVHAAVSEPALELREIVAALAAAQGRRPLLAGVPYGAAFALAAAAERLGVALPVTTENLRGLRGLRTQPASEALERLGWRAAGARMVLAEAASKAGRRCRV